MLFSVPTELWSHRTNWSYTWNWEGLESEETLVTVLFRDLGSSTEVELIHSQFTNDEEREKHNQGWVGCLLQLEKLF